MRCASHKVSGFLLAAATIFAVAIGATAAEPPAAPKVSTFAPAKDVAAQIEVYVARLEESVESEETFQESEAKVGKDTNTLILLALAAGLHDEDNKFKAAATAIMKA